MQKDYEYEIINEFITNTKTEEEFKEIFNKILLEIITQKEFELIKNE